MMIQNKIRTLELLAPAKNLECGMAAIDHGADAVYIGALKFGARASVGNSMNDITALCKYAHRFRAKVYVTVNTIIYEDELVETKQLLRQLVEAKVDAILVQDMAVLELLPTDLPDLPALHASTQTDNRSAEKVAWLHSLGFERVVLARELSLQEIKTIHHQVPDVELEGFVHGALCVSYSGVCYASQHLYNRSANRGECAQFCRMKFDLIDANGVEIEHQRHLLSLKDLCQIDNLEEMADAGICSFKIEGRLKSVEYVKNVVSAYSQRLNKIISKRKGEYRRASLGQVTYQFEPNLNKTFNRGYTNYFLEKRQANIFSPDTPKALGEYVGTVKEIKGKSFNVAGTASFANGDGLCFINGKRELEGFRVNRAEGNRLFPQKMPIHLQVGMALYRNNDVAFEKILSGNTAERKLSIDFMLKAVPQGLVLCATGEGIERTEMTVSIDLQPAQKPQKENIIKQLSKLGNTPFVINKITLTGGIEQMFVPSSVLSDLRRQTIDAIQLAREPKRNAVKGRVIQKNAQAWQPSYAKYSYLYNASNHVSKAFYAANGMPQIADAFEVTKKKGHEIDEKNNALLMQCRHCIRFSLGYCVKHGGKHPSWKEPLRLRLGDGRCFRLVFNCAECQMNVFAE